MASFPSEEIARLSYKFRTLGLGYANLGAMLMQAGIPYDSEKGRAICAAITAILTGESYAASAEMARELGAFPMYEANASDMLRVIRNHRRAAYDVRHNAADLEKMEASLPGVFEISFAFSPWTLGAEVMKRFEIPESEWQHPNFNFLRKLGFTKKQIDIANDIICGRGTVEGAPNLKD